MPYARIVEMTPQLLFRRQQISEVIDRWLRGYDDYRDRHQMSLVAVLHDERKLAVWAVLQWSRAFRTADNNRENMVSDYAIEPARILDLSRN